jgi:hypothetical protein
MKVSINFQINPFTRGKGKHSQTIVDGKLKQGGALEQPHIFNRMHLQSAPKKPNLKTKVIFRFYKKKTNRIGYFFKFQGSIIKSWAKFLENKF